MCNPKSAYEQAIKLNMEAVHAARIANEEEVVFTGYSSILPEHKLHRLLMECGIDVDAKLLRLVILAEWNKITKYAHAIHENAKNC